MDAYTVLLVDDEQEVIQVMKRKIHWEELGFSVLGYADNGVKALEMVEEFQPDVVITDIKMPYMDGMELSKRIRTEFPATKILIFTGFDEFEYAKEAVHLEVEEYLLKPVSSAELKKVLCRLKEKLDQEISEKQNTKILQNYYMESLPLLQLNFYSMLIEGRIRREELEKYLSDYQISFEGTFFCCLVIHTSSGKTPNNMNPLLLSTSVQKQAQERLGEKWKAKSFVYLGNTVLIVPLENENEISELTDECDRFCKYVHRMLSADVTIGVGQICGDILELSKSYNSAREAVSYRVLYGVSRAINIKEIAPKEMKQSASENGGELSELFKMIRMSSEEDIAKAVERCLNTASFQTKSLQQYHIAVMELLSALYRFAVNNDIVIEEFSEDIGTIYSTLLEMDPERLKKWLTDVSLSFREKLMNARNRSTQSFVLKAQELVREHYADEELSLDHICDVLGISNAYFSTIFKKEMGCSFITYLTDYRMERAARQLIETNEKSYMIAKNVGYTDANYFSYVFKRKFGVSPSKYRTEHMESEDET